MGTSLLCECIKDYINNWHLRVIRSGSHSSSPDELDQCQGRNIATRLKEMKPTPKRATTKRDE